MVSSLYHWYSHRYFTWLAALIAVSFLFSSKLEAEVDARELFELAQVGDFASIEEILLDSPMDFGEVKMLLKGLKAEIREKTGAEIGYLDVLHYLNLRRPFLRGGSNMSSFHCQYTSSLTFLYLVSDHPDIPSSIIIGGVEILAGSLLLLTPWKSVGAGIVIDGFRRIFDGAQELDHQHDRESLIDGVRDVRP